MLCTTLGQRRAFARGFVRRPQEGGRIARKESPRARPSVGIPSQHQRRDRQHRSHAVPGFLRRSPWLRRCRCLGCLSRSSVPRTGALSTGADQPHNLMRISLR